MSTLVFIDNNRPVTDSLTVADTFGKTHDKVLRDVRKLECSPEFSLANFGESTYEIRGKQYPKYYITKDGFMFLAMGFTGKIAAGFKEAYINEFNRMQEELQAKEEDLIATLPKTYLGALKALVGSVEETERLQAENLLLAPKADAYDTYLTAGGNITIGDFAKMLGTGQHRLFKWLRQEGILQDGGVHHNVPYQDHIDAGRFMLRALTIERTDPLQSFNKMQTLITPKGMQYVSRKWNAPIQTQMVLS